jgi:hypothetical protein
VRGRRRGRWSCGCGVGVLRSLAWPRVIMRAFHRGRSVAWHFRGRGSGRCLITGRGERAWRVIGRRRSIARDFGGSGPGGRQIARLLTGVNPRRIVLRNPAGLRPGNLSRPVRSAKDERRTLARIGCGVAAPNSRILRACPGCLWNCWLRPGGELLVGKTRSRAGRGALAAVWIRSCQGGGRGGAQIVPSVRDSPG